MANGKTIFITGATKGIGRYAALYFAKQGHRVIASGRKLQELATLAAEAKGLPLDTVELDVTHADSIAAAVRTVNQLTAGAGIDVLINNAGYGHALPMAEISDADTRAMYETNVFGLLAVTRAFLPGMMARRSGRILNVSSIGGLVTFPMFGVYNSTKYAVESLSDAMRYELGPFGIKVVLIEPGPIQSNFADRAMGPLATYRENAASLYAPVYARADKLRAMSDKQAVSPEYVARKMDKAITKRRPAARYIAPFSSSLMVWLMKALPVSWADAIVRRMVGLTPKALRLAAAPAAPAAPAAAPAELSAKAAGPRAA